MEEQGFSLLDESAMLTEKFYIGLMYKGPAWTDANTTEQDELEEAHLANLRMLMQSGKLAASGPCPSNEDLQSIYLYRAETLEEAAALAMSDPLVQQRQLICDMYPWILPVGLIQRIQE
jgi:uncharacterized protein YciI